MQFVLNIADAADVSDLADSYGYQAQVPQRDGQGNLVLDGQNNAVMVANPQNRNVFLRQAMVAEARQRIKDRRRARAIQAAADAADTQVAEPNIT